MVQLQPNRPTGNVSRIMGCLSSYFAAKMKGPAVAGPN